MESNEIQMSQTAYQALCCDFGTLGAQFSLAKVKDVSGELFPFQLPDTKSSMAAASSVTWNWATVYYWPC